MAAEMFQGDALSISELESIQQSRDSPSLAAQQLINILMRSPRETYHYFLDALKRTDQIDTYMCLVLEGEYCQKSYWIRHTLLKVNVEISTFGGKSQGLPRG